mmetsp:Transcript_38297/g.95018  ORF Transcript_38297/g.95018 Transcript_38297/m.95018 type:complete len:227 (-) Transcript_38297:210-890(-)
MKSCSDLRLLAASSFSRASSSFSSSCCSLTVRCAWASLAAPSDCMYAACSRFASACLERADSSATLAARAWPASVDSTPTSWAFLAPVLALMAFRLASFAAVSFSSWNLSALSDSSLRRSSSALKKLSTLVSCAMCATLLSSSSLACAASAFFSALMVAASMSIVSAVSAWSRVLPLVSRRSSVACRASFSASLSAELRRSYSACLLAVSPAAVSAALRARCQAAS